MNAVILFSHGSLLCGAGEALLEHARRLRERGVAPLVEVGYLNYSEPPFAETVTKIAAQGATRILVTPYFLIPGKFVKVDLPRAVELARAAYPGIEFSIADAIGFDARLADALIDSAHHAFGPERWREDLSRASRYCRANPECPLFGTSNCPRSSGGVEEWRSGGVEEKEQETGNGEQPYSFTASSTPPLLHSSTSPALLVMVHGSPRPIANEEMFRVVEVVKERGAFPIVEVGFMECNEPSIPEAIERCVAQGAGSITAVPYFLHTGTHVAEDLPTLLEEGCARYANTAFSMGAYLGRSESLTDILQDRIRAVL